MCKTFITSILKRKTINIGAMPPKKEQNEPNEKPAKDQKTSPKDGKKVTAALLKVRDGITELQIESHHFQEYDKLCDDRARLERELKSQGIELKRMQGETTAAKAALQKKEDEWRWFCDQLMETNAVKYTEWKKSTDDLEVAMNHESELRDECEILKSRATELEQDNDALNKKNAELLKSESDLRKQINKWERQLQASELKLETAQDAIEDNETTIKELRTFCGRVDDLDHDEISTGISGLVDHIELVAHRYFNKTIHPIQPLIGLPRVMGVDSVPLPKSNSKGAMLMRAACAQAIIGQTLAGYIFHLYPERKEQKLQVGIAQKLLREIEKRDISRAAIIRCQILQVYPFVVEPDTLHELVNAMSQPLSPWLDPQTSASFKLQLEKTIKIATNLWKRLLHQSGGTPKASIDTLDNEETYNQYRKIYDKLPEDKASKAPTDLPVLILFPKIELGQELVFNGCRLFSDQSAYVAAQQEFAASSDSAERRRRRSEAATPSDSFKRPGSFAARVSNGSTSGSLPADILPAGMNQPFLKVNGKT